MAGHYDEYGNWVEDTSAGLAKGDPGNGDAPIPPGGHSALPPGDPGNGDTPSDRNNYAPPGLPPPPGASPPPALPPPGDRPPALPPPPAAQPPPALPPPPTSPLFAEPGAYEKWIKARAGEMDNPSSIEQLYGEGTGLDDPAINHVQDVGPGIFQGKASGFVDDLSGQTEAEKLGGTLPTGGSLSTNNYNTHASDLGTPGDMESFYKMYGGDPMSAGASEDFYRTHGNDPMQKGYTETLYEQGSGKLDPYYDYAEKRAIDTAQRASAARGGFNTGLAAQQEGDITGNLRGQQAAKWVDLAPQADAAKLNRQRLGLDEATQSDAAKTSRERLGLDMAHTSQSDEIARMRGLTDMASAGDAADTARTNSRIAADKNAADAGNTRVKTQADISKDSEDLALREWLANAGLAGTKDDTALAARREASSEASAADAAHRARFMDEAGLEKDLQSTGQDRILGGLDNTKKLSDSEAALVEKIYGDMASEKENGALDATWLKAEADKYGVSMEEMKSLMSTQAKLGEMYLKGARGGA